MPKIKTIKRRRSHPAPVFMALSALLANSASAQTAAVTNAVTATVATQQPARITRPLSLTYGPFDFHPRLTTAMIYNDNITLATQHAQRDEISQVSPGLQIMGGDTHSLRTYLQESRLYNQFFDVGQVNPLWLMAQPAENWPNKFLFLDYAAVWNNFMHYSANDSLDHRLNAMAVWPMAKLVLGIRQEYVDAKEDIIVANTRTQVQHVSTALDAGYVFNDDLNLDTTWGRESFAYPDTSTLIGYTEWKGVASFNRNCFDTIRLGLEASGGEDVIASGSNQKFVQGGLRVSYKYSELITVDGAAGLEYRQFDSGIPSTDSPYAALNVRYQPWERFYITAGLVRQFIPALTDNHGYYDNGINLTLSKEITDRFSLTTQMGYQYDDNFSTGPGAASLPASDYANLGITAGYKVQQHVTLQLAYNYQSSGIWANKVSWEQNTCMLRLTVRF